MLQRLKAFNQINKELNLPRPQLEELSKNRLKKILVSAYNSVPYYREIMKGIAYNPEKDFTGKSDLLKFPVTTKKILKEAGVKNFIAEGIDHAKEFSDSTSGSSGTPIKVYRNSYSRSLQIARWMRVLKINGYKPTDKVMSLTSPTRLREGKTILTYFGLFRRKPVSYLNPTNILLENILEYNPDVLYGNRSQFDLIAMEVIKRKIDVSEFKIKLLISTGEILRENSRKLYKEAFNAEIIDSYGSVEMGVMGYETLKHDSLHLYENLIHYEFLDDENNPAKPGETSRIVLTDLTNTTMPFIRYEQGDRVIYKKESDESLRIINVHGRDDDYIVTPSGEKVSVHRVAEIVNSYTGIHQYRLIQRRVNHIEIYLAPDNEYVAAVSNEICLKLAAEFKNIDFKVFNVDRIPADNTGKLRKLISEVALSPA